MELLKKITELVGKYRYAVLILLLGVAFMLLPTSGGKENAPVETEKAEKTDVQQALSQILSSIHGVGRVEVLLTMQTGEKTVYQTEDGKTVIITDQDRSQMGLVEKVESPVYQGAIVVCQGADSPTVRLSVIEAVSKVTGLGTDRIIVLKMK